ncbi:hypothetical protein ACH5RR_012544 [Cinchona calisaya]|uniref:Uncharacterized protein n=1 Tax=Cinchona calisaya TaxID=153742 RepID=A0ABD3A9P0_9GENT
MGSRSIIEEGAFKRVGDGKEINLWQDGWIAEYEEGRVKSMRPSWCTAKRVEDLIKEGRWDHELIYKVLTKEEVNCITRIPISHRRKVDKLTWIHSNSGEYSVQSGYEMLSLKKEKEEREKAGLGESSRCMQNQKL